MGLWKTHRRRCCGTTYKESVRDIVSMHRYTTNPLSEGGHLQSALSKYADALQLVLRLTSRQRLWLAYERSARIEPGQNM